MKKFIIVFSFLLSILCTSCASTGGIGMCGSMNGNCVYKRVHSTCNYGYGSVPTNSTCVFLNDDYLIVEVYFKWDNSQSEYFIYKYSIVGIENPKMLALDVGEMYYGIRLTTNKSEYNKICYNMWRKAKDADYTNDAYTIHYYCTMQ